MLSSSRKWRLLPLSHGESLAPPPPVGVTFRSSTNVRGFAGAILIYDSAVGEPKKAHYAWFLATAFPFVFACFHACIQPLKVQASLLRQVEHFVWLPNVASARPWGRWKHEAASAFCGSIRCALRSPTRRSTGHIGSTFDLWYPQSTLKPLPAPLLRRISTNYRS